MARSDILHTERTYCEQGELFNATLVKKGNPNAIGLKKGLDPMKYGGYSSPKLLLLLSLSLMGKRDGKIISFEIPVYIANIAARQPEYIKNHLEEKKRISKMLS